MVRRSTLKKVVCLAVLVAFFGSVTVPELIASPMDAYDTRGEYGTGSEGMGRALGGAAGLAGGAMAGTALAHSIFMAAGGATGALAALPGTIMTACVVAALGLVGAKLGSRLGAWADNKMGPTMTWTLFGASIGAFAGLMFLGGIIGPWAGAMAPILKVLVGGVVGGVLGRLFAPQLQAHATPKLLYAGLGGFIGGLGFGIPGALAGIVGGYVMGGLFDRNLFSDPTRSVANDIGIDGVWRGVKDFGYWIKNRVLDVKDWVSNNANRFENRVRQNWDYDPYYSASRDVYPNDYAWMGQNQGSYSSFNPYGDQYYKDSYNTYRSPTYDYKYNSNAYGDYNQYKDNYNRFQDAMKRGNQEDIRRYYEQMQRNNGSWRY